MIDAHRKLVGAGVNLGRGRVGAIAVGSVRIVGQRIAIEHRNDRRVHRNGQRVAGKSLGVDALALRGGGHGKNLRGPQHLAKALVLAEIESAVAAVVNFGKHHRAAVGKSEFVAHKWRNAALVSNALVIEIIARVEGGIAGEFEEAAVHLVGAGLGDHVGEAGGAVPDLRRHHAGTGLHFLDGVHVEIGKCGAAHLRIGGVESIDGEDGGGRRAVRSPRTAAVKLAAPLVSVMVPAASNSNLLKSRAFSGRLETSPLERCSPPLACTETSSTGRRRSSGG